jgi:hypothetical protein
MTQTDLIRDFAEFLTPFGFRSKKLVWTRPVSDLIHVIELQKSTWSVSYYVNLAIQIPEIVEHSLDFHLSQRLSMLDSGCPEAIALSNDEVLDQQIRQTKDSIVQYGFPFLEQFPNQADLCSRVKADPHNHLFLYRKLREYCGAAV